MCFSPISSSSSHIIWWIIRVYTNIAGWVMLKKNLWPKERIIVILILASAKPLKSKQKEHVVNQLNLSVRRCSNGPINTEQACKDSWSFFSITLIQFLLSLFFSLYAEGREKALRKSLWGCLHLQIESSDIFIDLPGET